jgi:enterochelin esterase family protein
MKQNKLLLLAIMLGFSVPLIAQQSHVNIDWDPQRNKEGLNPFGTRVISPEVHDNHTVTFRLMGPDVNSVTVSGTMFVGEEAGKRVPLVKGANGLWSVTIGPLVPDIYIYSMQIDGVNVVDPANTITGNAAQPAMGFLWVHGDGPSFYDAKNIPHGTVTQHFYHSTVTNGERTLFVYTPPGYDPAKKYPVLYLMGGSGEDAESWIKNGQANFIMDNLLAENKVVPMIIVFPNNQIVHRSHPRHTELSFPLMEREFKEVILPYVENRYSIDKNKHSRAISGLSMGGRHTQYVGIRNLDLFGSLGILSAAMPIDDTPQLRDSNINAQIDYLFVGAGTYETNPTARHQVLHDELVTLGVKHEYLV